MRVFAALESFSCLFEGEQLIVHYGDTVREGHPLLAAYPDHFAPQKVKFEHLEKPSAAKHAARPKTAK